MPAARSSAAPAILDHLAALADTTRSRVLLLLDRHELTVSELCGIVQLPQSTVSRHLKALADSGWIAARSEGTSRLYTMTRDELDASARRLWLLVREQVGPTAAAGQDQRRLRAALAQRRTKSARSSPAVARLSSTCSRTIARATVNRWVTSGSAFPTITYGVC